MLRKTYRYILVVLFGMLLAAAISGSTPSPAAAQDGPETPDVVIYMFWGEGCPHCAVAKPYLETLDNALSGVEVRDYEVYYNQENQELFIKMAGALNFEPRGVPTIIIGDTYWEGFSESIKLQIEEKVRACMENGCPDAGAGIIPQSQPVEITREPTPIAASPTPETVATPTEAPGTMPVDTAPVSAGIIKLPLIGEIDLATQSLAISTLIIAFVDGFNPCSLWVLSMLIALTIHTGSRRKILIIGLVFITITALVYVLFIAGLFSLLTFISFFGWIQVVIALLALFFAAVNIKDYFWYKEGISFTIADDKKSGIFQRIRRIMDNSQTLWGLVSATVVMAAGVSLVEFSCTAGFPVLWTNLLAAQNVETPQFIFLLAIYMLVYQIDELAIFLVAVFTLKASKLEEKQGRILKLVGGMLMLTLAVVMLSEPAMMNSLSNSLLIFGIAFAAAMLVLLVHRKILPAFGIWIGSEQAQNKKRKTRQ